MLKTLPGHQGTVTSVNFNANGKLFFSGGDDGLIITWYLEEIRKMNELAYACNWVRDYLRTNVEGEERDSSRDSFASRHLCDGIKPQK